MEAIVSRECGRLFGDYVLRCIRGVVYTKTCDIHETDIDAEPWCRIESAAQCGFYLCHTGSLGIVVFLVAGREIDHKTGTNIKTLCGIPFHTSAHETGVMIVFRKVLIKVFSSLELYVKALICIPESQLPIDMSNGRCATRHRDQEQQGVASQP